MFKIETKLGKTLFKLILVIGLIVIAYNLGKNQRSIEPVNNNISKVEQKKRVAGEKEVLIEQKEPEIKIDNNKEVADKELAEEKEEGAELKNSAQTKYKVSAVIDGDTVELEQDNNVIRVRLIGINTPEVNQCYFDESKEKAKELLEGREVTLEKDETQEEKDIYGRILGYIILPDSSKFGETMLKGGFAKEYTYKTAYKYQKEFKEAEDFARSNQLGLWAIDACGTVKEEAVVTEPQGTEPTTECVIKGNINSEGEKIYHKPGCMSYKQTVISPEKGERWFCTEEEAVQAGWRIAGNCY